MGYTVVIPTVGRRTLSTLVRRLARSDAPLPEQVLVVNDRPTRALRLPVPDPLAGRLKVLAGPGRGPAAARNVGWRSASTPWVVFIDDDVIPDVDWHHQLTRDLADADETGAGAVAGNIRVPAPVGRRPTDWERQVAGLAAAPWITADIAYRLEVLRQVGGFDERFPRAYREDTDLALRVCAHGHSLTRGSRHAVHAARPEGAWVSVRRQRGNADDALLRQLYGRDWRRLAGAARGRRPQHALATGSALAALTALAAGRRGWAGVAGLLWLGLTAEFAAHRIAPGPRTPDEVAVMLLTSAVIPPAATLYWLRGWLSHRSTPPFRGQALRALGGEPR